MLNQSLLQDLRQLKLTGMADSFEQLMQHPDNQSLTLVEGLGLLVSHEMNYRDNRRLSRLLKTAKLRFSQACVENINYQHKRQLNKQQFLPFTQADWLEKHYNVMFIGPTGVGKSYLACALGNQACRLGFSTLFFRLSKLFEQLKMAHADGSLSRLLLRVSKTKLLILDDWGIDVLNRQQRNDLLEIIEDRYQYASTIITTQLPIDKWHHYIGDNTIADAILDRLLSCSTQFTLTGASLRQTKKLDP